MIPVNEFENKAINTIRFLSVDAVQAANSGHPGLPMGVAAIAYTLWTKHLHHNPNNPSWSNRDRFILSGGHGATLLYSLLYLTGYDLPMEQLKQFRQWGSMTQGHPEYGKAPGIELTTGPLGAGFATGVGMAMAETHLAAKFNKPGYPIVDHFTYAVVTDGDLMEGVSSEAASIAGHFKLGKLIYFYDDNRFSIDGPTDIAFTEDRGKRFDAYGWQVLYVKDGNNVDEIDKAIEAAKIDPRPSLIICRTIIGYGLPNLQNTAKAHGAPPGEKELDLAKESMGWPLAPRFYVPDEVLEFFRQAVQQGITRETDWEKSFAGYKSNYPDLAADFNRRMRNHLPQDWENSIPVFSADPKGKGTRISSGLVLNALAKVIPELISGSADLTPSNNTYIDDSGDYQAESRAGRNIHYGVREHAMGSILNGINLHNGLIAAGGTFFIFSDYMRPAIRLSALSDIKSIWILTHDSIGLGEDGATHQPVEHLASLRAIPNLVVLRPADANEVAQSWKVAIKRQHGPSALILSRQNLPTIDRAIYQPASGLEKGAYILVDMAPGKPEIILMASGSEVNLIIEAGNLLSNEGYSVRLVSFPSWELFEEQDQSYRDTVLPPEITRRIAVEAGRSLGWHKWVGLQGKIISMETFGTSAPADILFEKYGFTVDNVIKQSKELLG